MKKTDTIMAIKIEPDKYPELIKLDDDDTLEEQLADIVHGDIECIYPFSDDHVVLICDEEGKCKMQTKNRAILDEETGELRDIICGTFVISGVPAGDQEGLVSLTQEQLQKYCGLFRQPELITTSTTSKGDIMVHISRHEENVLVGDAKDTIVVPWKPGM